MTVVLISLVGKGVRVSQWQGLVTGGKGGEGRLAKPGAGLIQPLCRRDGHGRPGYQGEYLRDKGLAVEVVKD